jgi:Flp pilus assembly protein CpaB
MKRLVIILGVILLIFGVTGLVHPSFSYHKQEEVAKIGPLKATVNEEKVVEVPAAVSIVMLVAGIGLILVGPRLPR